jgi:cytochrome c553
MLWIDPLQALRVQAGISRLDLFSSCIPPIETMVTRLRVLMRFLGFAAVGLFAVSGEAPAADIAAGKALAEGCAGCHGADGVSQTLLTPSLAAEPDYYTQWQLVYFRGGARKNEVMGPIAEALNNDDIKNLGAYYASLPPPKPEGAPAALAQRGEKIAATRRCASCHADDFSGNAVAARLADQREDVLLKALQDYKSGARVGSGVATMAEVAFSLSDDDMKALAHYMASRP